MGWVKWLVLIASFFVPIFGFITFWVFAGKGGEMGEISRGAMIASFFGLLVYVILLASGVTILGILFPGMGLMK